MAEAPITKIITRVKNLLDRADYIFHIDRSDDEPLDESERPGGIIRVPHIGIEDYASQGMDLNRAILHIDFHSSGSAGETIDTENQREIANAMNLIAGNRTLDGMIQSWEAAAISGSENDGADVGCAIFESEILFFTRRDNPFVIVGQGGQQF